MNLSKFLILILIVFRPQFGLSQSLADSVLKNMEIISNDINECSNLSDSTLVNRMFETYTLLFSSKSKLSVADRSLLFSHENNVQKLFYKQVKKLELCIENAKPYLELISLKMLKIKTNNAEFKEIWMEIGGVY